jgi:hypothetical protein
MNITRRLLIAISITITFIIICIASDAQTTHSLGNWEAIFLKAKISPKWSLMSENHIRSSTYSMKYDYFEVKTGISYGFSNKLIGLFGSGYYDTDQPGGFLKTPALQKEFRTWLELTYKQEYKRLKIDQRVRIEQRFITGNYKNRFKYLLGLTVPVNQPELIKNSIYLAVNDEIWLPQYGMFMEKNRLFAGAGYKMNDNVTWQIGCVSDTDYKPGSHTIKNYLQLALIYDLSKFIKKHS